MIAMDVKKCDRCGKIYEHYRPGPETKESNAVLLIELADSGYQIDRYGTVTRRHDLCEECMKDLVTFLDNPPSQTEKLAEPSAEGDMKRELEAAIADLKTVLSFLPKLVACQFCKYYPCSDDKHDECHDSKGASGLWEWKNLGMR